MSQDILRAAIARGFDCVFCGRTIIGRPPVRSNDIGPFFCTFLCALDFRALMGDADAQAKADTMRSIFQQFK
jgi:hypothetical protein